MNRMLVLSSLFASTLAVASCGDSGSNPPQPSTTNSAAIRAADDLRSAGSDLKAAATEAATQAKPALEKAAEETKEAVHNLSQKIADRTATPPTTTQP